MLIPRANPDIQMHRHGSQGEVPCDFSVTRGTLRQRSAQSPREPHSIGSELRSGRSRSKSKTAKNCPVIENEGAVEIQNVDIL